MTAPKTPASAPETFSATRNACKLCSPLGASLVFRGIAGAVPFLHGSQGCATYIRRYLISHYREPMDIASSSFGETAVIFGGGQLLQDGLANVLRQYEPSLIGIATTCLAETIGDDVPMFLKQFRAAHAGQALPPLVHVATPSYAGTHADGFYAALRATVATLAEAEHTGSHVNLIAGMHSPADLRHLREILAAFRLPVTLFPDYADTLDGPAWADYRVLPPGGTTVAEIRGLGAARATLEFGRLRDLAGTAGAVLQRNFGIPLQQLHFPIGVALTDAFLAALAEISRRPVPESLADERGRLIDALVDGHKYLAGKRVAIFGDEDLVLGLAAFCGESGLQPVLCASGGESGVLRPALEAVLPPGFAAGAKVLGAVDFARIESEAEALQPDLFLGNSKGYAIARRLGKPLVRVGFPIHDRLGAARLRHLGYGGALQLLDRMANALIAVEQDRSPVGYSYI